MAYYTKVLQPDETVRYVGRLHWVIYQHAIIFAVLTVCAFVVASTLSDNGRAALMVVAAILLVLAVLAFFRAWFVRVGTEIVVTDKRIIHKVGWLSRHTEEMNIAKVETVDVDQGIAGRIFGFGAVLIKGIGGSWEPLQRIASPLALRNAIILD